MADVDTELSRELSRILACQYPTSLSKLADILARTDGHVVRRCIQDRPPCAVSKLASLVIDSLPLWAYSLQLLEALCHSPEFKDEVLLQSPGLLNALLTKANSSQRNFDECAPICVRLLSSPPPEAVPLPASAQTFFLHAFERATKDLDVTTWRLVYLMLNGACRELLHLLSSKDRQTLDEKLCQILSSNTVGQDPMLILLCFGIVILFERPHEVGKLQQPGLASGILTDQTSSDQIWISSSGRKLFGSAGGMQKTMNLAYLNTVFATKSAGISNLEAVEGIRIAIRTITFIDPAIRHAWAVSSAFAQRTFEKLPEKIMQKETSPEVQFEAMCFYAMVAGQNQIQNEIVAKYEHTLCHIGELGIDSEALRETLCISLPLFAPQLRDQFGQAVLTYVLECNRNSFTRAGHISTLSILLEQFSVLIPESVRLRSQILSSISSEPLQSSIAEFLERPATIQVTGEGCGAHTSFASRRLFSGTVAMLLISTLSASNAEPRPSPALSMALVSRQQDLATSSLSECSHVSYRNGLPAVSLFQQECTPSTGAHQRGWQDRVKSQLIMQSAYQHESIIRSMAEVCHDLEHRCANVEEPLLLEKRKVNELTAQVDKLNQHVESIASKGVEQRLYIDGLEMDVNNLENENEKTSIRLNELQNELADARQQAEDDLHAAQESFNTTELQLRSIITTQEGMLATQKEEIKDLNVAIKRAHKEADAAEEQLQSKITAHEHTVSAREESINELNGQIGILQDQLQKKQTEFDSQQEAIQSLREECRVIESKRQIIEEELKNERCTVVQQVQELELLRSSHNDLQTRLSTAGLDLQTVTTQLSDLKALHKELVQSSAQALRELEDKYHGHLDAAEAKIHSRDLKIEQLTESLLLRERELSELQKWKKGVLSSITGPAESSIPDRTQTRARARKDHHVSGTSRDRQRKSGSQVVSRNAASRDKIDTQGITGTAMEDVANASFESSNDRDREGSTPKRAKTRSTRTSFKNPATHTPCSQKPTLTRSLSIGEDQPFTPTKRSALRIISPNRRHTTVGFAISEADECDNGGRTEHGKRRTHTQVFEDMHFDVDGSLASMPFTPGNVDCGTGRAPEEDCDESDTLEL